VFPRLLASVSFFSEKHTTTNHNLKHEYPHTTDRDQAHHVTRRKNVGRLVVASSSAGFRAKGCRRAAAPTLCDASNLHTPPAMLAAQVSSFVRGDTTIRAKRAESTKPTARRAIEAKESRIGKVPVAVPKGVTYTLKDNMLAVKVGVYESDENVMMRMCASAMGWWRRARAHGV